MPLTDAQNSRFKERQVALQKRPDEVRRFLSALYFDLLTAGLSQEEILRRAQGSQLSSASLKQRASEIFLGRDAFPPERLVEAVAEAAAGSLESKTKIHARLLALYEPAKVAYNAEKQERAQARAAVRAPTRAELLQAHRQRDESHAERDVARGQLQRAEQHLAELQQRYEDLARADLRRGHTVAGLRERISDLLADIDRMRTQLSDRDRDLARSRAHNRELETYTRQQREDIEQLSAAVKDLQQRIAREVQVRQGYDPDHARALEHELATVRRSYADQRGEHSGLVEEAVALRAEVKGLRTELRAQTTARRRLADALSRARGLVQQRTESHNVVQQHLDVLSAEISDRTAELRQVERLAEQRLASVAELQRQMRQLKSLLADEIARRRTVESENLRLSGHITQLQAAERIHHARISDLNDTIREQQLVIEELQASPHRRPTHNDLFLPVPAFVASDSGDRPAAVSRTTTTPPPVLPLTSYTDDLEAFVRRAFPFGSDAEVLAVVYDLHRGIELFAQHYDTSRLFSMLRGATTSRQPARALHLLREELSAAA